ncbi:MAG: hypothetical protein RI558_05320 [Psychroflexus sp.]|nr:hypothetical protein [Psychroflexus sp.]MDR9448590.1 hypothetical protein [Psychroflexus sp.]
MRRFMLFVLLICLLISCADDVDDNTIVDNTIYSELSLNFDHHVGDDDLVLSEATYQKNGGETFQVDTLKYIISNIVLHRPNGDTFKYPVKDSYFLINEEAPSSLNINLTEIPEGEYDKISFGFGVDQSNYPLNGVDNFVPTAEENGMLWAWAAGYKFLKFEGTYSTDSSSESQNFLYHVGSHGTNLDNYKEIVLNLNQVIQLEEEVITEININMDVLKIFNAVHALNLSDKDDIQVDPENAPKVSENMRASFSIDTIISTTE